MASAVRAALVLAVLAQLTLLFPCAASAGLLRGGTFGPHSLSYYVIINSKPAPGQQWCTVQAQVDQKTFLSYDCGVDKVKTLSALGEKVNATVTWREQNTALRDIGQMLKQKLADIKAENPRARDLLTLEGRMSCERKSSGCTSASWLLGFNGQMWFYFDSDSRRWTEVSPGSNWMKEMWKNDRDMTEFLHRSSMGDCKTWLKKFLEQWEEELEPPGPSSMSPDRVFEKSTASKHVPSILLLILICFILLALCKSFLTG